MGGDSLACRHRHHCHMGPSHNSKHYHHGVTSYEIINSHKITLQALKVIQIYSEMSRESDVISYAIWIYSYCPGFPPW